jgi:HD-GYP domain-containing protein (c-di-GMP phosphodiesterase class II)
MATELKPEATAMRRVHQLAMAVDLKDRYTHHHSERVAVYATATAVRLGLSLELIRRIVIAGKLHDVGKIAVSDDVLLKPGALTEGEFELVKSHSEQGERIVESLGIEGLAAWIRHHHERWDGRGYPDGMAGERIPLPSRILGAADALDAMTTARAYSEALSVDRAIHELRENAGSQFDPEVAACLVELLGNGTLELCEEHRVTTSYTITEQPNDHLRSEDYDRIREALFPADERRNAGHPKISVSSSL